MAKKIKITRKQMKRPDDFLSWSELVWDWSEKHTWLAAGAVAGVVVLFLAIQGVGMLIRSSGQSPRAELAQSVRTFKAPIMAQDQMNMPGMAEAYATDKVKYEKAAAGLATLVRKYPAKPVGEMAMIYLARSRQELGDYDAAIASFQKFLKSNMAGQEPTLKYSALMGLGQSLYAAGKYQEALDYYNQVKDSDSVFKPDAMLAVARCQFKLDHPDKAKEGLAEARKDFPDAWLAEPSDFLAGYWEEMKNQQKIEQFKIETGESSSSSEEGAPGLSIGGTESK
ncbi:MAG TPA: tetratricopeptide repeat protein [bacterium]|nr:tetratricopeptide repeat protein [bacterium]